jgi:hypothetical protein
LFNITGLTAHVAYELARMVYPSSNKNGFLLFRLLERRSKKKYWSPFYFDFVSKILHQYDHEWQRLRKTNTINRKNRLPIVGCQFVDYQEDPEYSHAFQLVALGGQITWTLAALNKNDKQAFQEMLGACAHE